MKNKRLKGIITLSLSLFITFATSFQANAVYYERPSSMNANYGYNNSENIFASIDAEYYKQDYMRFKIDNIKDITNEFDSDYIRYNNVDRIVKIDYTYTNLQYNQKHMFVEPEIAFQNAISTYSNDSEYIPKQLYKQDYDELEKPYLHPSIDKNETASWSVVYIIHNKLNGERHKTIDINFNNVGYQYNKIIWSIPVENLK